MPLPSPAPRAISWSKTKIWFVASVSQIFHENGPSLIVTGPKHDLGKKSNGILSTTSARWMILLFWYFEMIIPNMVILNFYYIALGFFKSSPKIWTNLVTLPNATIWLEISYFISSRYLYYYFKTLTNRWCQRRGKQNGISIHRKPPMSMFVLFIQFYELSQLKIVS